MESLISFKEYLFTFVVTMLTIKQAEFIISSTDHKKGPQDARPEFAFIGRSNVGKSSLINMLTNQKKLAKTSGTPGKTRLINHFLINDSWYLVDLPGYGYARASKKDIHSWEKFIVEYLLHRDNLVNLFVLIDSRLDPQKIDLEFINWCGEKRIPFSIVFTKLDKLSGSEFSRNLSKYKKELQKTWQTIPPVFSTSSTSKHGRESILNYIEEIIKVL